MSLWSQDANAGLLSKGPSTHEILRTNPPTIRCTILCQWYPASECCLCFAKCVDSIVVIVMGVCDLCLFSEALRFPESGE
jgi:hypothetical protein